MGIFVINTSMEILDKTWPPDYNLRLSKKAKHIHLKILPDRGLEIIVPIRQQKRLVIADLLNEKKSWIEKHLAAVKIPVLEFITVLHLQAIQQTWHVEYKQTLSRQIRHCVCIGEKSNTITLYGDVQDIARTQQWLKKWLTQMARTHLLARLEELSLLHNLPFNKAAIRAQQTLWGSCTTEKNISLNYKLLFIPANYADHIMLHELCHTKYLNHSKYFWNLLIKLDPKTLEHNKALRQGDSFVPSGL